VRRRPVEIVHHVTRRHRAEVEVSPARATATFADERAANPADTFVRFEATTFNACNTAVRWQVLNASGGPGAGTIDRTGLYAAPDYAPGLDGHTDVVVATLVEDPLRTAFAWVTLVGEGPWPAVEPTIQLRPKTAYLYYPGGHDNAYIDPSNTMQFFRAQIRDSGTTAVEWRVDGVVQAGETGELFLYKVTGSGGQKLVRVEARISGMAAVKDTAEVMQINYDWPGLH
jgi:hypothetical protein